MPRESGAFLPPARQRRRRRRGHPWPPVPGAELPDRECRQARPCPGHMSGPGAKPGPSSPVGPPVRPPG
eukprot:915314-Alexandrium_andersonii.AAC.1